MRLFLWILYIKCCLSAKINKEMCICIYIQQKNILVLWNAGDSLALSLFWLFAAS